MYRESFYQFLMTQRNPNGADEVEQFANFWTPLFQSNHKILRRFLNIWKRMLIICLL